MKVKVTQSCLILCDSMDCILDWVTFPFSRGSSNSGIEPRSPTWQADSLPAEPQGKPNNTGVGSLSLLQEIFPTQESNQGLLHCRQILYQLSYQGIWQRKKGENKTSNVCWERKWQPTSVFLPGKSRGQRSLPGYSLWSHKRVGHD